MNLSCSTTACPALALPDALEFVGKAGYAGIELFRVETASAPELQLASLATVRRWIADSGLALTGLNIRDLTGRKADTNERNLTYNLHQLEWDMHLAHALHLRCVNVQGGRHTAESLEDLIEGLNQMIERLPDMTINLASRRGTCLVSLADYREVLPQVGERVRLLLDTGNLIAAGQDVIRCAETFADRIGLVRLRDHDGARHVPVGEGRLPFGDLFKLLRDVEYDGCLVVALQQVRRETQFDAAVNARRYVEQVLHGSADREPSV